MNVYHVARLAGLLYRDRHAKETSRATRRRRRIPSLMRRGNRMRAGGTLAGPSDQGRAPGGRGSGIGVFSGMPQAGQEPARPRTHRFRALYPPAAKDLSYHSYHSETPDGAGTGTGGGGAAVFLGCGAEGTSQSSPKTSAWSSVRRLRGAGPAATGSLGCSTVGIYERLFYEGKNVVPSRFQQEYILN